MKSKILWFAIGLTIGVIVGEIIREIKQTYEEVEELDIDWAGGVC